MRIHTGAFNVMRFITVDGETPMKNKFLFSMLLLCLTGMMMSAQAADSALKQAPDFQASAALAGQEITIDLAAVLKKGPAVVYFYPAAFTSGCTVQAHAFAAAMPQFDALHATVVGVSGDDIGTLRKFSKSECSSKFAVASDPGLKIAGRYGAAGSALGSYAQRKTFVIAPDGKILATIEGIAPGDHAKVALDTLNKAAATSAKR